MEMIFIGVEHQGNLLNGRFGESKNSSVLPAKGFDGSSIPVVLGVETQCTKI
jgi:hypothetical protein